MCADAADIAHRLLFARLSALRMSRPVQVVQYPLAGAFAQYVVTNPYEWPPILSVCQPPLGRLVRDGMEWDHESDMLFSGQCTVHVTGAAREVAIGGV